MLDALPDSMPRIDAAPPHWLYWLVLMVFPLIAMILARRPKGPRRYDLSLGYFILLLGGFVGLHRFYLKNMWGLLFLPLFAVIIYGNAQHSAARVELTNARAFVVSAERDIERYTPRAETSAEKIAGYEATLAENPNNRLAGIRLRSETRKLNGHRERIAAAEAELVARRPAMEAAQDRLSAAGRIAVAAFALIVALMVFDAFALPMLIARANRALPPEGPAPTGVEANADHQRIAKGPTGVLDSMAYYAGEFAAYWAVIAVLTYFFEVVSRYVFNSPTIWAHEGMYLMFGMQYMFCGAYAMLTDSHVRVDIFYANFSARRKAVVDILTSIFFFIFAGVMLVTGWIFAMDATIVNEVSTETWAIHRWPFKWAIVAGALLMLLQGVSKLIKDIHILRHGAPMQHGAA